LKWAESRDGFIAPENAARESDAKPFWISGTLSRRLVHKWRTEEMAILVGTQTAIVDNPALTAREWEGKNPHRLLIDRNLRVPAASKLLDNSAPTAVFYQQSNAPEPKENLSFVALNSEEVIPKQISSWAQEEGLNSLIVEGGAQTLNLFISTGYWDEARIFQGPSLLKKGINAPEIKGRLVAETLVEHDRLQILRND
jgi:diaminohydroxyphosphoribosylaminopyrimidine deaminase/5-amino-6-(5-phosphoribosylamino)uracil reductase